MTKKLKEVEKQESQKMTFGDLEHVIRPFMMTLLDMKGRQFSYAVERNLNKIDSLINANTNAMYKETCFSKSKEFNDYYEGVEELTSKFGTEKEGKLLRDESGEVIISEERKEEYKIAIKKLQEDMAVGYLVYNDRVNTHNAYMLKTVPDIDYYMIMKEDYFPEEITARQRMMLRFMTHESLLKDIEVVK